MFYQPHGSFNTVWSIMMKSEDIELFSFLPASPVPISILLYNDRSSSLASHSLSRMHLALSLFAPRARRMMGHVWSTEDINGSSSDQPLWRCMHFRIYQPSPATLIPSIGREDAPMQPPQTLWAKPESFCLGAITNLMLNSDPRRTWR